jgi:hypothetical protein
MSRTSRRQVMTDFLDCARCALAGSAFVGDLAPGVDRD